jgi:hypothetical protein
MPSLKQLEQQKAELDLKITQSLEVLKKMDLDLEQARLRQEAVEQGAAQIAAGMAKYDHAASFECKLAAQLGGKMPGL